MTETESKTALVLGATGGVGGAVARRLAEAGWSIRALNRNVEKARRSQPALDWRQGDALSKADVRAAAEGAHLIVHAVNPPGYRNWSELVLPMLDSTIAAARAVGAPNRLSRTMARHVVMKVASSRHPRARCARSSFIGYCRPGPV